MKLYILGKEASTYLPQFQCPRTLTMHPPTRKGIKDI
jgi:hypothetical protein